MGLFGSSKSNHSGHDDDMRRAREEAQRNLAGAEADYKRDPHPINKAAVEFARRVLADLR